MLKVKVCVVRKSARIQCRAQTEVTACYFLLVNNSENISKV